MRVRFCAVVFAQWLVRAFCDIVVTVVVVAIVVTVVPVVTAVIVIPAVVVIVEV